MKERFAQFLFKRIKSKMDDTANAYDSDEVQRHIEDLDIYIDELKDIVMEVLKP